MTRLPRWVWDVLADLVRHEDVHAKGDQCLSPTLARVPADVLAAAQVIAEYRIVDAEVIEEQS